MVKRDNKRRFPILSVDGGGSIPWWVADLVYATYHRHHREQTLERLAERGGFGWEEVVAGLQGDEAWRRLLQGGIERR